jgi:DNA-binding NarL/FixJ family response regulator
MKNRISVLIVDDHKIMREGLKSILDKYDDIRIAGEAANGIQAIEMAGEAQPDVIIMDINMPDLNGIDATERIKARYPKTKVLALSMHSDRGFLIKILKSGASGYLLKDCASDELVKAIQTIMNNSIYISPVLIDDLVREYVTMASGKDVSNITHLTSREREVLQKIAEGMSAKEIAYDLNVSVKTIETFRHRISEKLGLHSVAELTKYAIREGLTSL